MNASQTIIYHLIKDKTCLEKVRAEVEKMMNRWKDEDPSLKDLKTSDLLDKKLTLEECVDLEYTGYVISEAMRFMTPVANASYNRCQADFKAGSINFRKGDEILFLMYGLHYNSSEWQRMNEFLPERFDPTSPLYLTPSGKKRNPFSWAPFSGGKRICFGKTFAEANLKMITVYMS